MAEIQTYPGMTHLAGHLLAAIDLETTGTQPGHHEIIQIAIVPLDKDIKPLPGVRPFYTNIKPGHPERESEAASKSTRFRCRNCCCTPRPDKVEDWLVEWFEKLRLPFKRCLVPLAHNWAFESSFLKAWLGVSMVDQLFHSHARDSMLYAIAQNDRAVARANGRRFCVSA